MYTFDLRYPKRKNCTDLNQVNGRANRVISQWDQMTREHFPQNPHCTSRSVGCCPILLKPNIFHIVQNVQVWSEKSLKHLTVSIRVHSQCNVVFFEEVRTPYTEFCHSTLYSHPRTMQRAFMQLTRVVLKKIALYDKKWHYMYFSKKRNSFFFLYFICLLFNVQMCQIILPDPVYVTVRLWNQWFREMTKSFSHFVKWLWGSVISRND